MRTAADATTSASRSITEPLPARSLAASRCIVSSSEAKIGSCTRKPHVNNTGGIACVAIASAPLRASEPLSRRVSRVAESSTGPPRGIITKSPACMASGSSPSRRSSTAPFTT
jgi:hypothetical protein